MITPALQARPGRFTVADHASTTWQGRRHEVVGGTWYDHPSPGLRHQHVVGNLLVALRAGEREAGETILGPFDVILSDTDVVQPDVVFVSKDRLDLSEERGVFGAPDLVVEVLSPATRRHDEIRKRKLYEEFGVQAYWIVDPDLEAAKAYRMTADGYERTELSAEHEETLTSPLLPDFALPLVDLFA